SFSGIVVDDSCLTTYADFKLHKYKYVIYKISDDKKSVVVEATSDDELKLEEGKPEPTDVYERFMTWLPKTDARFAVYDFDFEIEGGQGGTRNKILFYSWVPDSAGVKSKMLYASTINTIRDKLEGVAMTIQATEEEDLMPESVKDKMSKFR
ncbi:cofilin, partial [Coemansia sp. RSA 2706]